MNTLVFRSAIFGVVSMLLGGSTGQKQEGRSPSDDAIKAVAERPSIHPHPSYRIFVTFDDGPSAGSRFVDSLVRADSLPIDVFVIGVHAHFRMNREMIARYSQNPFIEIGNHSYTHAGGHYQSYFSHPNNVLADFNRNQDSLQLITDLARLPGRNYFRVDGEGRDDGSSGRDAADSLMVHGYKVIGWDLEWSASRHAGAGCPPEEMLDIISRLLTRGKTFQAGQVVILLHDREMEDSAFRERFAAFIRLAREDGRFAFGHLSEYGSRPDPAPGN